jgi:hypothetical protein
VAKYRRTCWIEGAGPPTRAARCRGGGDTRDGGWDASWGAWRPLSAPPVSWPRTAAVWRASRCRTRSCHWGETRAKPTAMGLGHPCRDEVALAARSATGAEERACGQHVSCEGKAPCHRMMGWSVGMCWANGDAPGPTTSSPPQGQPTAYGCGAGFRTRRQGGMPSLQTRRGPRPAPCETKPTTPLSAHCSPCLGCIIAVVDLLEVSMSCRWWQAVVGRIGFKSRHVLRIRARGT